MEANTHDLPADPLVHMLRIAQTEQNWKEEVVLFILRTFTSQSVRGGWISFLYSHLPPEQRGRDRIEFYRMMYATRAWQRSAPATFPKTAFKRQALGYTAACKLMNGDRWTLRQLAQTATVSKLLSIRGVGDIAVHEVRLALAYQGLELRED